MAEEDCPCLHNEATYQPGDTIRVDCNTWWVPEGQGALWEGEDRPCKLGCVLGENVGGGGPRCCRLTSLSPS